MPTILDIKARRLILCIRNVLPSGILLLEDNDRQNCWEHLKNFTLFYFLIYDYISWIGNCANWSPCFVCDEKNATTMFLYDQCQCEWHMAYLILPLLTLLLGDWICK